jgi:hypothetical protein
LGRNPEAVHPLLQTGHGSLSQLLLRSDHNRQLKFVFPVSTSLLLIVDAS